MKRIFCYLLPILLAAACICPVQAPAKAAPSGAPLKESELYARSAVLMDADSGRVLFGKDDEHPMPMASTTKIMTCIVTLENADLDDVVQVSAYAAKMPDVQLNINQGEYYKLGDLLHSLMLESHNDSAVAIAEHVGGSVEGFAKMMNEKAVSIGCKDTYFITPNGLDASETVTKKDGSSETKIHSTTASDLARILRYCISGSPKKEEFLKITRTGGHSFHNLKKKGDGSFVPDARSFSCVNHNAFLHMMDGALTGKTGFTGNAGYCYVGALKQGDRTFVIALLACGWPNNKTYKWKDARKLFQYGIDHYQKKDITDCDYKLQPVPVENGAGTDRLVRTQMQMQPKVKQTPVTMLLADSDQVEIRAKIPKKLTAPVKKGSRIGSLDYYVNGEPAARMPVYASEYIGKRTLAWYFQLVVRRYFYPYSKMN